MMHFKMSLRSAAGVGGKGSCIKHSSKKGSVLLTKHREEGQAYQSQSLILHVSQRSVGLPAVRKGLD